MLRHCCNNTSNALDDMRQALGVTNVTDAPRAAFEVRKTLKVISSTLAGVLEDPSREAGEYLEAYLHSDVSGSLSPQDYGRAGTILDDMLRSTSAFMQPVDASDSGDADGWNIASLNHMQLAFWECGSAIVRSAMTRRRAEAPSSWFNAGVSLLRARRQRNAPEPSTIRRARVIVNALGVWWALESTNAGDLRVSMVENDGIDCAVNMMGAISELFCEESDDYATDRLHAIGDQLRAMRALLPGSVRDFLRLDGSFQSLNWTELEKLPPVDLAELQRTVAGFFGDFVRRHFSELADEVQDWHPPSRGQWSSDAALKFTVPLLRNVFSRFAREMASRDAQSSQLEERFVHPLRTELAGLEKVARSIHGESDQETSATDGDSAMPQRRSGIRQLFDDFINRYLKPVGLTECPAVISESQLRNWSQQRWEERVRPCIVIESDSLADALIPERLQWLVSNAR